MDLFLLANLIIGIMAFASFIYGVYIFKNKKALYGRMITLAMLCIVFGRLFNIVRIMTGGNLFQYFQLGLLGSIGSIMFFFTSNYGALDSLVDDGSKEFSKYRKMGFIAPAIFVLLYIALFLFGNITDLWKIQSAILIIFISLSSYYHFKHIIIPDVEFGVVNNLKPYNTMALLYMGATIFELFALSRTDGILTMISYRYQLAVYDNSYC